MKRIKIVMLACLVLLSATTNVWAQTESGIKIVKPGDRRNMGLGKNTIIVEITGVDPRDVTWQVLVDSELITTVTNGGTTADIDLTRPTGPRRIRVVMFDKQNREIASNEILVIAAPIQPQEPIFNREVMAQAMGVFVVIVVGLLIGAFVVSRRVRNQPIHSIPGAPKQ
ncbi:MAG: hypothetical protein IT331_20280 [Anaerolineae bacterium]|nr:hypothetical protein [Anaerolineae bacterium]